MKKICILLLIFACFAVSFGQTKVIGKDEFIAPYERWKLISKEKSYRIKQSLETKVNGNLSGPSDESFSEFVPPDKRRFVSILKTPKFTTKIETISIGGKEYSRKDGGTWQLKEVKENTPPPQTKTKMSVESTEYKYLGQEKIDGEKTDVYEQVIKHKMTDEKASRESISTIKTKYWYGESGLLLKMEAEMEITNEIMPSYSKRTYIYEYDPNIKIEAPIKP
jgi:hypothetical protein